MAASNAGNGSAIPSQDGHASSGDKAVSEAVHAAARFMEIFDLPQVAAMRDYIDEHLDYRDQRALCEHFISLVANNDMYGSNVVPRLNTMVHADVWEADHYHYHDGDDSIIGVAFEPVLDDVFGYAKAKTMLVILLFAAAAPLSVEDSWFRYLRLEDDHFPPTPVLRDECYGRNIFGEDGLPSPLGTLNNPLLDDTLPNLVTHSWPRWFE